MNKAGPVSLIGLAGPEGAGKSDLSEALAELGCERFYVGDAVRQRAAAEGFVPQDHTREAYLPFYRQVAAQEGPDWIAQVAYSRYLETGATIVIDGVRIPADAEYVASRRGLMLYLHGDREQLDQRLRARGRPEDMPNDADQDQTDKQTFGLNEVAAHAEHFVLPMEHVADEKLRKQCYRDLGEYILDTLATDSVQQY